MRAALKQRVVLAILLLLAAAVLTLEYLVYYNARLATSHATLDDSARILFKLDRFIFCAGPFLAGLLIDNYGLGKVFRLTLLVWCGSIALAAVVADPLSFRTLWPAASSLLPGFILAGLLVAARLGWPARRRGYAVALLLLGYEAALAPYGIYFRLFNYPDPGNPVTWQYPMFALATIGSVIAALWLVCFREVDGAAGLDLRPAPNAAVFRDQIDYLKMPAVWSLLAIELCVQILRWYMHHPLWDVEPPRAERLSSLAPQAAAVIAFFAVATYSDTVFRRTRSWLAARRPFIVGAFLATAAIALIGSTRMSQADAALEMVGGAVFGVLRLADLLVVDLAPRSTAGTFIGVVLSAELILSRFVAPIPEQLAVGAHSGAILVCLTAVVGAALGAVLIPRMRPAAA